MTWEQAAKREDRPSLQSGSGDCAFDPWTTRPHRGRQKSGKRETRHGVRPRVAYKTAFGLCRGFSRFGEARVALCVALCVVVSEVP